MDDYQALLAEIGNKRQAVENHGRELSNYDLFLEALLKGKHPPFCELVWNGEAFHIVLQLHFQKPPQVAGVIGPEAQQYRREAWGRFRKVRPDQQRMMQIRVTIKNYLPVTAEVTVRPEAMGLFRLGTAQLLDIQNP
ncbi:MAG: hypothetical protein HS114_34560 [Anaerolineales bacterium]|nr:hypothetical protein [Anaerolineales bacterium]